MSGAGEPRQAVSRSRRMRSSARSIGSAVSTLSDSAMFALASGASAVVCGATAPAPLAGAGAEAVGAEAAGAVGSGAGAAAGAAAVSAAGAGASRPVSPGRAAEARVSELRALLHQASWTEPVWSQETHDAQFALLAAEHGRSVTIDLLDDTNDGVPRLPATLTTYVFCDDEARIAQPVALGAAGGLGLPGVDLDADGTTDEVGVEPAGLVVVGVKVEVTWRPGSWRVGDPETRALVAGPSRWRARHAAPARRVSVGVQTDALRELTDVLLGGEELTEERARALLNLAAAHFGRERVVALAREFLARA